jgi:hypothetical protein
VPILFSRDCDWRLCRSDRLPRLCPDFHSGDSMKAGTARVGLEASHEKHRGRSRRDHRESNG